MALYGSTIFLSSFLLFQIQLVVGKTILPWFGGSSAVWTSCLLFFQLGLLLGYVYADWSVRSLQPQRLALLHFVLLLLGFLTLPAIIHFDQRPMDIGSPVFRIIALLGTTIGLPYVLLSATSPLVQALYARTFRSSSPYTLFALSNAGSMLGLITYPVVIEPTLTVTYQAQGWALLFALFALLCSAVVIRSRKGEQSASTIGISKLSAPDSRPGMGTRTLWMALAACPSILLLAVTNHITQNLASIPFLWVVLLSLYLGSFVLCFSRGGTFYRRRLFLPLLVPVLAGMAHALAKEGSHKLSILISLFAGGFFVCCMVCHGELARRKPAPNFLTSYYLMISLGGAVGGIFVGLVAPSIFSGYYELHVGIVASAFLLIAVLLREIPFRTYRFPSLKIVLLALLTVALSIIVYATVSIPKSSGKVRLAKRNFYSCLRVVDWDLENPWEASRELVDGVITHGAQLLHPLRRRQPTTYYGARSGVGLAIRQAGIASPVHVGVVGLGAGTLATYGRPGDDYRFYEINPLVVQLATTEFRFLRDSEARINIIQGDARLSLEQEPVQRFDVLVIDAFSSDAIPIHLLTKEAFAVYFRHLKDEGILAVHVTNRYLDLRPVVGDLAASMGKAAVIISAKGNTDEATMGSDWILATGHPETFEEPLFRGTYIPLSHAAKARIWTDDFSNMLSILKRSAWY